MAAIVGSKVESIVVISDTHFGDQFGLCPPAVVLPDGGTYSPSRAQRKVWEMWKYFWVKWVPMATRGKPFAVVHNGDMIDNVHHGTVTPISHDKTVQRQIAIDVLSPIVAKCEGRFYCVGGTEAHAGQNWQDEEEIARAIQAKKYQGRFVNPELRMVVGRCHVQFCHHIGTTSSAPYETTAILGELVTAYTEAARWGGRRPDIIVRSHRHRNAMITIPTDKGYGISLVTAGWQLKTPFVHRMALGRHAPPQIGGTIIHQGNEEFYARHRIWHIPPPKEIRL
jgi:hypothetical protein